MMTTTPGTMGLLPAAGVRRYWVVKVTASPVEGHIEIDAKKKNTAMWLIISKHRDISLRFDLCYFQGFHQMVLTESFEEGYQTWRGYWGGTTFSVYNHTLQCPPERKKNEMIKLWAALHQNVQSKRTRTCESRAPMVLSDPAALMRRLRRAPAMLILSAEAGTRKTKSKRPPTHTADMITYREWKCGYRFCPCL